MKMHYHNANEKPKYLFGERNKYQKSLKSNDEIYLNKSGWVQVNQRKPHSSNNALQKYNNSNTTSKLEALISRNEIRRIKCTIDPHLSAMLNERPGFLPIKQYDESESPPTITPIISPPPAFQDSKAIRPANKLTAANENKDGSGVNKGMVFSRSFEYAPLNPYEYAQTFSKSFDYDFLSPTKEEKKIEKENAFPNSRDSNVCQQHAEQKEYNERGRRSTRPRNAYNEHQSSRSRRTQFSKQDSTSSSGSQIGFRSQQKSINKRLNSCDSGARSGNFIYNTQS